MSESDLSAMNLRELRQLASEHHVNNRSRLAKQELVAALASVMSAKAQSDAASKDKGKSKDKDKAAAKPKKAKASSKKAAAPKAEPEVLDANALAAMASATKAAPQTDSQDKKTQKKADDKSSDAQGDQAQPDAKESGDAASDETKRRRRRGRGRGRSRGGRTDAGDDSAQNKDAESAAQADQAENTAAKDSAQRSDRPQRQQRTPKPQLDRNKLRSVEPVLNRLKSLAGGMLELCDPDTPSWAQARISELLAEAGVHPTPCQGPAHPDFHEVLSTVSTEQVPEGHIAVIESPGFSLRGDRGDLFALRKARVRVAGKPSGDGRQVPAKPAADAQAPEQDPAKKADPAESKKSEAPAAKSRSKRSAPSDDGKESESKGSAKKISGTGPVIDEPTPAPAPHAHRAPAPSQAASLPLVPQSAEELEARGFAEAFGKLGLHQQIQADLHAMGFEQPSPIQEQCIPLALAGNDIIGQAQTGTGKTAAFTLPILHHLYNWSEQGPVALIMCPTRELAKQVHREFVRMSGQSAARAALIYGGVSMDDQYDALATHPHVIIGTPGRLIDHIKRHTLDLSRLKVLVLDEADQMLDIGFLPDIEYVLKHSNPTRQCLLFSATMSDEILRITQQYQKDPAHVHVKPELATADHVDQKFIAVDRNKKNDLLAHFIETHNPEQLVVFCKTKAQTDRVAQVLRKKNKKAAAIHGDLPQNKRERTLQQFREGTLHCLIATNVAARGLDIPAISHVVNYDIPENPDEYVHRIGRTGRMGASGVARTFITKDDGQFLVEIEKLIGFELEEEEIEGFTASTIKEVKRTIADTPTNTPRLLKPLVGGIRLGRRRR